MNDNRFRIVNPYELSSNVFELIDHQWFLITAGKRDRFNTMTASWGGMGILWNKPVVFVFVRPTRYTYSFMNESDQFTLSFLSGKYRNVLNFCGKYSGKDVDKIKETGLAPVFHAEDSIYFEQASLVLICRKLYYGDIIAEQFQDEKINKHYPNKDYHRMFIGEVVECLEKIDPEA